MKALSQYLCEDSLVESSNIKIVKDSSSSYNWTMGGFDTKTTNDRVHFETNPTYWEFVKWIKKTRKYAEVYAPNAYERFGKPSKHLEKRIASREFDTLDMIFTNRFDTTHYFDAIPQDAIVELVSREKTYGSDVTTFIVKIL